MNSIKVISVLLLIYVFIISAYSVENVITSNPNVVIVGYPNMSAVKYFPPRALIGDVITIKLVVDNYGIPLSNIVISDKVPSGAALVQGQTNFTIDSLEKKQNDTFEYKIKLLQKGKIYIPNASIELKTYGIKVHSNNTPTDFILVEERPSNYLGFALIPFIIVGIALIVIYLFRKRTKHSK